MDQQNRATWYPAKKFYEDNLKDKCSRNTFYQEIKKGNIPHLRIGKKIFVPDNALEMMFQSQMNSGE